MNLSKNFTVAEFEKSQVAIRHGLNNEMGEEELAAAILLATKVLQPTRDHWNKPVTVSSGYRSPAVNVLTGGSKTSSHCEGEAADIEIAGVSNYDLAKWIEYNLVFDQLILEYHDHSIPDSGWVHVSYRKNSNRKQVLFAQRGPSGKTIYFDGIK